MALIAVPFLSARLHFNEFWLGGEDRSFHPERPALAAQRLVGTLFGVLVGHVVLAVPVACIVLLPALACFDWNQVQAARSLGADWARVISVNNRSGTSVSLLSATLTAFLTSLDEFVISIFIASGRNSTMPKLMFLSLRDQIDPTIAAISTLWTAVVVVVVVIVALRQKSATEPKILTGPGSMPKNHHAADDLTYIVQVGLAIITGSANWGLAFPEDVGLRACGRCGAHSFETPFGRTDNWKLSYSMPRFQPKEEQSGRCACIRTAIPATISTIPAIAARSGRLMQAGVRQILACSPLAPSTRRSSPATWW